MNSHCKSFIERFRTLITLCLGLCIGASLLLGESCWSATEHPIFDGFMMLFACFFAAVGAFGRIWCSLYIAGYKNNVLVTDGPYAMCRNPLYLFSLIGSFGVSLATETITIPILIILAFACYYPPIIKREQRRLREIFGERFGAYCATTPAFFPRLRGLPPQPTTYTVNPFTFTHNFVDAIWFILFIGIFELIEAFHMANILPVLFKMP